MAPDTPRGRGTGSNPANRFTRLEVELEGPGPERVETRYYLDSSRTIVARNESPDVPFPASVNPYRGCEHGCIYCYARPYHEYLGFSAGLDFESRILVKQNAAALLRDELLSARWQPAVLGLSGVTDPYQPVEKKLEITRSLLQVLLEFRNPVGVVTKNALVTRDLDLLQGLAAFDAVSVHLSITSLDGSLTRRLEPRTSHPRDRLEALSRLSEAGVRTGVLVAPVIPGLNDHEIPAILEAAANAGARTARYIVLRLPGAVAPLFEEWLGEHYPDRRKKVMSHVRAVHEGKLTGRDFQRRMVGRGVQAEQIRDLFELSRRRFGLESQGPPLSTEAFRRPGVDQLGLFS